MRSSVALFALALGTVLFVSPCNAQAPAQGAAAKECFWLHAQPAADPGGAIKPLAEMLIKGEGGPADPKRAVSLLTNWRGSDVCQRRARNALHRRQIGATRPKKGIDLSLEIFTAGRLGPVVLRRELQSPPRSIWSASMAPAPGHVHTVIGL